MEIGEVESLKAAWWAGLGITKESVSPSCQHGAPCRATVRWVLNVLPTLSPSRRVGESRDL